MTKADTIPGGVVHELPPDLRVALASSPKALATWEDITPLARNEWICWIEFSKAGADPDETDRLGLREPGGRQTPALLLARLPSSRLNG